MASVFFSRPCLGRGICFALAACFLWGLIFVMPRFMAGFSCVEIALSRYLSYGIASGVVFFRYLQSRRHSWAVWKCALYLSLSCSIGYYSCVVLAIRYATPAVCALILGLGPITIAVYGNWREKEGVGRSLVLPALLILVGLVLINVPHLKESSYPLGYLFGLFAGLLALMAWTWYAVANSHFLKAHPEIDAVEWAVLIGLAGLVWVVLFGALLGIFGGDQLQIEKYLTWSDSLRAFLFGALTLGLLCSLLGTYLWNQASLYLPVSLVGQLSIFETVFGLLFVYALEGRFPPYTEAFGIVLFLLAVAYGIRTAVGVNTQSFQPRSERS